MRSTEASRTSLERQLTPLVTREISGIAALDTAIAHVSAADYVVMFQDAKNAKQANVEQMATLIRMQGGTPDERGGIRKTLARTQASIASRLSTTKTLQAMRVAEIELITLYAEAVGRLDGLAKRALRKALGRALVQSHLLTAHIAKRTGSTADAQLLPAPLGDYFAGADPRACMRCHLDRPGKAGALERTDPHPYTYLCAACHGRRARGIAARPWVASRAMVAPGPRSDGAAAWPGEGVAIERDRPRPASPGRLGAGTTNASGRTRRDRSRNDTGSRTCTNRTLRGADNRKGRWTRRRVH